MPIVVTPTLSSTTGYVDDVRDQVATLVRFIIMNPGFTSELWEGELLSFRKLSSAGEAERDVFANRLGNLIESKLNDMFKDWTFTSDFSTSDYEEGVPDGRYSVHFNIMMFETASEDQTKLPALVSGSILVDKKTNEISLTYDQSLDNLKL